MQICTKCGIEKTLVEFHKSNSCKLGIRGNCKECVKIYKNKHKNRLKEYKNNYDKNHKRKQAIYHKKWYKENKLKFKQYKYNYQKNRLANDFLFRVEQNLRRRFRTAIKSNIKSDKIFRLIGCSIIFLKKYLEAQFKDDMTWENYGLHGWHIDHIKPCASFDLSKPEEQHKCFHYTNLQPLWWYENLKKGCSYE